MKSIQEAVASVQNAQGVLYTGEYVINLLNSIQVPEGSGKGLTRIQIEDLCQVVVDTLRDNSRNLDSDVIDKDSAEFELYGNEIQLTSVDFDGDSVYDCLTDGISDAIEEFFEELEKENEEEEDNEDNDE